jgi:hypothetical protein
MGDPPVQVFDEVERTCERAAAANPCPQCRRENEIDAAFAAICKCMPVAAARSLPVVEIKLYRWRHVDDKIDPCYLLHWQVCRPLALRTRRCKYQLGATTRKVASGSQGRGHGSYFLFRFSSS